MCVFWDINYAMTFGPIKEEEQDLERANLL